MSRHCGLSYMGQAWLDFKSQKETLLPASALIHGEVVIPDHYRTCITCEKDYLSNKKNKCATCDEPHQCPKCRVPNQQWSILREEDRKRFTKKQWKIIELNYAREM